MEQAADRPRFVFYEGPPTANGTPHNGHVLTRVIKDLFPRYKTMRGYRVDRKAGWDTHGLPVEVEVEKALHMREEFENSRQAIDAYGLDNFSRRCIESVFKYTSEWETLTERVGFWVDLQEAYVTYHRSYVESVWWALKTFFDRGLLYQDHKVLWWWPEGGTGLSAGEVGEGYRDVDDPSITTRFRLKDRPDTSLLAWTTTPWTTPSNVALAVGPDLDYAYVRVGDEVVITAEALKPEGEVLEVVKGSELLGLEYEPLYKWDDPQGKAWVVVPGEHVSLEAGTGIVHTAPAYGEEDYIVRREHDLGILIMVGPDGRFDERAPEWVRGMHFKAADKPIIADLEARGLMFARGQVRHSYPFSPRSKDDPLMQLARPAWFISTRQFKDRFLANNDATNWLPNHIQEGRFGDFLRNNVDWALSRERYWGTPLPIWICADCDHRQAFDSMEGLKSAGATGFAEDENEHLQVHRPWIDRVVVPCPKCGGQQHRVPEVIDCWFDSGSMPFAQWGFPHKGIEEFKNAFPADFISEAVDQTRGWFYTLLAISTMLFDEETCEKYGLDPVGFPRPFKNCIVLGHVSDMTGKKESKSLGNYTSPDLVLRGRMLVKVVPDDNLPQGSIGMSKLQVRSIDLAKGETMRVTVGELDEGGLECTLKGRKGSYGKETVAMNPADMVAAGVVKEAGATGAAWLHAPFAAPGSDAFRWLFYASNPPWTNTRLSLRAIRDGQREFHLRLGNVFQFFTIYANIAGFDPEAGPGAATVAATSDHALDRWVLAECDATVRAVTRYLDDYLVYEAARAITDFVDGLSNWYVRRSRSRFWGEGPDTTAALATLYSVLKTLTVVVAPLRAVHGRGHAPAPRPARRERASLRLARGRAGHGVRRGTCRRHGPGARAGQPGSRCPGQGGCAGAPAPAGRRAHPRRAGTGRAPRTAARAAARRAQRARGALHPGGRPLRHVQGQARLPRAWASASARR